ncbi:hypothetical protein J2X65_004606 [Ancylobacter sp. 3268]|uniref:hypothetical protein n=1 Tax=Ancylobacter sp. 3268 TaxID=2817752 RepID=UPI00285EFD5F|nr:hypothetical protein [Ancylobacter sp. 3268]MDR6955227.1 hypothetical protein [Ancylobacter sp. 3268]
MPRDPYWYKRWAEPDDEAPTIPTAALAALDRACRALEPARRFAARIDAMPATRICRAVAARIKEITPNV